MSARVQSSPFRETEFDQRLDRMLDDLKSTVTDDEDSRRTPLGIRSSSRSSSRAGSIGRRGLSVGSEGVSDGGKLTHHRREYTSPDQQVRTVAETYQYDSGDTHPSGNFQKKVVKSTYSSYNVDGGLSTELDALKRGPSDRDMERALSQESRNILNSSYSTNKDSSKVIDASQEVARELVGALSCIGKDGRSLSNGHFDDDMIVNDEKGGEVRRIVWRNRYEKTYGTDTNQTTHVPQVSIERDAKNRRYNTSNVTDTNDLTTISSLTRPHVPPQISPGGQSWAEPVPLPTPPQQISPREPGVAYIYNYGSSGGSAVQPLPPLNYVAVAPGASEGAPSPTPSGNTPGQPVIYHYSYHYTIQPGQALPDGAPKPPVNSSTTTTSPHPPALQIAPPPASGYSQPASTTNVNKSTNITEIHRTSNTSRDVHHHTTSTTRDPSYPGDGKPRYPGDGGKPPGNTSINYTINTSNYRTDTHDLPFPTSPADQGPRQPSRRSPSPPERNLNDPNRNITININKTTTHTTRTTRDGVEYPPGDGQPLTSTPYRGRSNSPDRRYPPEPRYPSGPSDSLERVRRTPQPGMPFPDASPLKPQEGGRIPRKVDDLMTEFPERNGGPYRPGYPRHPDTEPLLTSTDVRTRESRQTEIIVPPPERNEINTVSPTKLREEREKSKNLAGPPVYYPPGHEAFSETMHTMTLKEGGRRGKAKWRREAASGYAESSSHSESKGGMKMVPVCLPLCCGAACTIM